PPAGALINGNTYSQGTVINGGTLIGTALVANNYALSPTLPLSTSPFGTGNITIGNGTLQLNGISTATTTSTPLLTVTGGAGLTVNAAAGGATTFQAASLVRQGSGTLVITPATGSLNTNEIVQFSNAPQSANGIVAPWIVAQTSAADPTADFVSVAPGNTLQTATAAGVYSSATTLDATTSTSVFLANSSTTNALTGASDSVYALRVDGVSITDAGGTTLTVGNGSGQAGIILNNALGSAASIAVNTLAFGAAEGTVYTGGALTNSISSAITGSGGLTVFGPGSLTITGNNSGLSGTVSVNLGGALNLNSSNPLGTGTVVLDGAGAGVTLNTSNFGETLPNNLIINTPSVTLGGTTGINFSGAVNLGGNVDTIFAGAGPAEVFNGAITNGGLSLTGSANGEVQLNSNGNTFAGGLTVTGINLESMPAGSGSVLGTGSVTLSNSAVELLTSNAAATSTSGALSISGNSVLYPYDIMGVAGLAFASLNRVDHATLDVIPGSGGLGTNELVSFATAPSLTNGIVSPWVVTQQSVSNSAETFVSYSAGSLQYFTAFAGGGLNGATPTQVVDVTSSVALSGAANPYALQVDAGSVVTATGQTLTIGNGSGQAGLILNSGSSITGGTLAFGAAEGVINVGDHFTSTISAGITGTGGLTIATTSLGGLTLSGNNTGLSGTITANAGTINVNSAANQAWASTASLVINGSLTGAISSPTTVNIANSQTLGSLSSTGMTGASYASLNLGSGAVLTVNPSASTTFADPITGAGGLTMGGTGTLALTGSNTFSGGLSLNGGIVNANADAALGGAGGSITFGGGTLQAGGSFTLDAT
ncbi:MAG TPA: hypothetical protein VIK18_13815, partial [Pirellulales bacterium]